MDWKISETSLSVEPFHLFRDLDEQGFRSNHRKMTDGKPFNAAVSGTVGERVTFEGLTGKISQSPTEMRC